MERANCAAAPFPSTSCGAGLRRLPRPAAAAATAPPSARSWNLYSGVSTCRRLCRPHSRRCLQRVGDGNCCVRRASHLPTITLSSTAASSSSLSPAPPADAREESSPSILSSPSAASDAALVFPDAKLKRVTADSLQYASGYLGAITGQTRPPWGASWTSSPPTVGRPGAMDYLANTLTSRVYDVAIESPLQRAPKLSERLGIQFWLKREDLQPVFSFKLRGAYNMMANLPRERLEKGVICSSAGNHAQGVALSAQKLGCNAVIAMPVTTPEIKWKSVERLGATVVLVGDSYDEAQSYAKRRAEQEGRTFIPPFDNPQVIMGQGTVGMEIVRQLQGPLHAIFVPVGGGGLIAGIAAYVKQVRPEVKIIGVEPSDANAMALSLHHGQRVMLEQVGGFADGVAVKVVGEETFRLCRELVDGVVLVSRDAICASIKLPPVVGKPLGGKISIKTGGFGDGIKVANLSGQFNNQVISVGGQILCRCGDRGACSM